MNRKAQYVAPIILAAVSAGAILLVRSASAAFLTPSVATNPPQEFAAVCWHDDPSDWHCTDSSANRSIAASGAVASASVTVGYTDGRSETFNLPARTDAIFLSRDAIQNFLHRYYRATRTKGAAGYRAGNAAKAAAVQKYISAHTPQR